MQKRHTSSRFARTAISRDLLVCVLDTLPKQYRTWPRPPVFVIERRGFQTNRSCLSLSTVSPGSGSVSRCVRRRGSGASICAGSPGTGLPSTGGGSPIRAEACLVICAEAETAMLTTPVVGLFVGIDAGRQVTRGLERAREGGALGATMSYTQLHAATSMLHWIFRSTSRDTVFSCTQWDHRNPGTGTQAPNAARKGSPGPTRHRRIIPPTQYLRWNSHFPAPLQQHQGSPTLALDWNGTKINPDSAGPRESRQHLLLWS